MDDTVNTPTTHQATTTSWFRTAAPYIHAHRDATFVIAFDGETIATQGFESLLHDIAILNSLGIKLVLVFGARPQIEAACQAQGIEIKYHRGLRITDQASHPVTQAVVGQLRLDIEAKLSFGLPHTPMADARVRCTSGNLVTARPAGILDGIDLGHTGEVRRIDIDGINQQLALDNIVLLPPLGFSLTGEMFNVSYQAIATAVATALSADKLIFIGESNTGLPRELTMSEAEQYTEQHAALASAITACQRGVKRVHLLDRNLDGALLQELFSRDGAGTLVSASQFETIRRASIDDVGGILELLQPLEANGTLVKRSRELLEREIDHFTVMERDGTVIACAALYSYPANDMAELACLAVSSHYHRHGRGKQLLTTLEKIAQAQGIQSLYVLTTQTAHWFLEQGFKPAEISDLPVEKQALYNYQRNSKVFHKALS
jgi:amino-acid N-acetyltransferase